MKKLKFLPLILVLFIFSCKVSTEKGKEKLDAASDNVLAQIDGLEESEFNDAAYGFFSTSLPSFDYKSFATTPENIKKVANIASTIKNAFINRFSGVFNKKIGSDKMSLSDYAGTYTWNFTSQDWDFSDSPTDIVIFNFPSENSTTNDCRFEWLKYEEVIADDYYYPSVISAKLYKDDNQIGLLDVNVEYDAVAGVPNAVDFLLELNPMSFTIDYKFENKIISIDSKIKYKSRTIDKLETELVASTNDIDEILSGTGVFETYKIDKFMNTSVLLKIVFSFEEGDYESCDDFNNLTDIKIYASSNRLIGDVICDENSDCGMIILFNDGTTEEVCTYFEKIETEIVNVLESVNN